MQLQHSKILDDIYKLYGVCGHHCANVEYGIAFLLTPTKWKQHWTHLERMKGEIRKAEGDIEKWGLAQKRFDDALAIVGRDIEKLYKYTLGNLIQQLKAKYPLSDEQVEFFDKVSEERNFFIHELWGKYGRRLANLSVQAEMLKELQRLERDFGEASTWVWEQAHKINGTVELEKSLNGM